MSSLTVVHRRARSFAARQLFVPASASILKPEEYADLLARTTLTSRVYEGVPLSTLSTPSRGQILEAVARRHEEIVTGICTGVGLRRRGNMRSCDWLRYDGTRVEVKAAQFTFDVDAQGWRFQFQHVMPESLRSKSYAPHLLIMTPPMQPCLTIQTSV